MYKVSSERFSLMSLNRNPHRIVLTDSDFMLSLKLPLLRPSELNLEVAKVIFDIKVPLFSFPESKTGGNIHNNYFILK